MESKRLLEKMLKECESEAERVLSAGGSIPCEGWDVLGVVPDHIRQWIEQESHEAVVDLAMLMLKKIVAQKYKIDDLEANAVDLMDRE